MGKHLINGTVDNIQLRVFEPGEKLPASRVTPHYNEWVVLCHPHPKFGGDMDNKVITTLERAFQGLGYGTVIFNFRGVGRSEGEYDGGHGEQQDLESVVLWLKSNFDVYKLILAGFSFGGYVALKAHQQLEVDELCVVAPAIGLYDFSGIEVVVPWLLIQGGEDEVVCAQEVLEWVSDQRKQPDIYWRAEASHFFHRQLVWLKQVLQLSY